MKSLAQLRKEYIEVLSSRYTQKEIDTIFYTLAEAYLHKKKSILQLGLNELYEESEIKSLLFQHSLFQLSQGVPYQYIVGNTEFYGCKILVNPNVLIPRPETEELVDWVIQENKQKFDPINIIDLCTGSGCIAIALAKNLKHSKVSALEVSSSAVELAKKNAELNQVDINFIFGDLLDATVEDIPNLDVIVSNPPYIRNSEIDSMEDIVVQNEPALALFVSDNNPLIFYQAIIDYAYKNLKPSGSVYVEINQDLAEETQELFSKNFILVELKKDLSGKNRLIKAKGIR